MGKLTEKLKDNIAGVDSEPGSSKWLRAVVPALLVVLVINLLLTFWWSSEPDIFSVEKRDGAKTGEITVATLIQVIETLQDKPGGYLSNDIIPPSVFMDNIPSWEYGVVVQVRDLSRALRKEFSRSQSQSLEDGSLSKAETAVFNEHTKFILPAY